MRTEASWIHRLTTAYISEIALILMAYIFGIKIIRNNQSGFQRNFLGQSFHEQCAITSEPIGGSDEQYEMLQDEVNQLKTNYFENDFEDHPAFDIANVPKERLKHWKNVQQFVKSRREWYAQQSSLSPEEAEQKVREEWKLREIKRVEAAKHARTIEQRLEQAREAAQAV